MRLRRPAAGPPALRRLLRNLAGLGGRIRSGKARAIGVSSFYPDRLVDLCRFSEIKPMVDQVETHVFQQQRAAREVMDRHGVAHES